MNTLSSVKFTNQTSPKDTYLEGLLKQWETQRASKAQDNWLQELRHSAAAQVLEARMPTRKDEDWRFTDLSELSKLNFQVAKQVSVSQQDMEKLRLAEADSRLVFVNGFYDAELSDSVLPNGVFVGNLNQLRDSQRKEIDKYLARQPGAAEVFTALNTSALADVAVIWAAANVVVKTPIHLLFLCVPSETPTISQPRTMVVAERGSGLQLIEHYDAVNHADRPYFTNAVTEIWVEENAEVNHTRVQLEADAGFHIGRSAIAQARDSRYTCNEINFGGKLSRHNLEVYQQGEQTETHLNGLTMIKKQQLSDTHSLISLTYPYGTTDQLHKCIVSDRAHAVFNGKVLVPQAAQQTNAAQLNRNLLLSPKARVDTKPELQITADNVKCSHGATVSQLEPDELFYLRSRGLSESDARYLLVNAFATEIIERLPVKSLQDKLSKLVNDL